MDRDGRLREITFREIGEGRKRHRHRPLRPLLLPAFIWDDAAGQLVGAYRLGLGDQIMEHTASRASTYSLLA